MEQQLSKFYKEIGEILINYEERVNKEPLSEKKAVIILMHTNDMERLFEKEFQKRMRQAFPKNTAISNESQMHKNGLRPNVNKYPVSSFSFREGGKFVIDSILKKFKK